MPAPLNALGEHWVGRMVDLLCFGGATWLVTCRASNRRQVSYPCTLPSAKKHTEGDSR